MSVIHIQGLGGLKGAIEIQGSKNAVLPVMAASLLHRGITVLRNVPKIQDVYSMMEILEYLGCELKLEGHSLTIDTGKASGMPIPVEMAGKMRSSIMLLGPMLGRFREAVTSLPGGCCLGKRPSIFIWRDCGSWELISGRKELRLPLQQQLWKE